MSDLLNEQLSALVDGELAPEETALLLRRLEREPELAQRLARYRLCGEVLRGEHHQPRADFALRISAAIAREPASRPAAAAPPRLCLPLPLCLGACLAGADGAAALAGAADDVAVTAERACAHGAHGVYARKQLTKCATTVARAVRDAACRCWRSTDLAARWTISARSKFWGARGRGGGRTGK